MTGSDAGAHGVSGDAVGHDPVPTAPLPDQEQERSECECPCCKPFLGSDRYEWDWGVWWDWPSDPSPFPRFRSLFRKAR